VEGLTSREILTTKTSSEEDWKDQCTM
jgi:hypothetical protein